MLFRTTTAALLAGILVLAISLPATAAGTTCQFNAYANDPDPAGANVRSGPSRKFPVIGVLTSVEEGDDTFAPEFTVSGFENGFFKIGDATTGRYGDGPEQTVFKGPGWIFAKLTGFEIQDANLRDAPSAEAPTALKLEGDWGRDEIRVTDILGCEGNFIEVTITNPAGQQATGWATDICGNQATTCS